jgi:cytosine/adenosine deaminase-related metal-dependent hydrolase
VHARGEADELTGSELLKVSLAPHAPYSVSPDLFRAIRRDLDAHPGDVSTVHLAESPEEVEFTMTGSGAWREVLEELGAWTDTWEPPAASPISYLERLGVLDSRVLAVHAVQCTGDDVARLRRLGVTVVSCPRSNRHVGVGDPPLSAMYAAQIPIAFGTDSLASVSDLNLFEELAAARRIAPAVPARELLRSATITGARALGFDEEFGTIETGKRASLIAVRLPDEVDDVEEYLLTGIEPGAITWLDPSTPNAQFSTSK